MFLDHILKPVIETGAHLLSHGSLPRLDGEISVLGLENPVEILRDRWGIPHIYAQSIHDLLFAQGYVHAQDRLWQMDINRRLVAGRMAEVLGEEALPIDRWIRVLGLRRATLADEQKLSDQERDLLNAYAAGVNARIAEGHFPIEFTLLSYHPEPWKGIDSLSWSKMMSWGLSGNWESELLRAALAERLGPALAAELELEAEQPWPNAMSVVLSGLKALELARDNQWLTGPDLMDGVGSNNWVLSGSRTVSGKPLLANDMHLPINAPAIWYENHLSGGGVNVTGVSFPGVPLVIVGHNQAVAWGFTAGFADVQDLYIEHLRREPDGQVLYEYKGDWLPAEVRQEEIKVRGEIAVNEEVVVTRHGPLINPLIVNFEVQEQYALQWTALQPDRTITALVDLNRAESCSEFKEALRNWHAPVVNVVYADIQGNIGYSLPGDIPIRQRGSGRVPAPGWTGTAEWQGMIPFDELPRLENPPQGFIATANNRVADENYPYDLGSDYVIGDRARRIVELIAEHELADLDTMRMMQYDLLSPSARWIASHLGLLETADVELSRAISMLREWNAEIRVDSPAAALHHVFMNRVIVMLLRDQLGELTEHYAGRGPTPILAEGSMWGFRSWEWFQHILDTPDSHWFEMGRGETRDGVLLRALRESLDYLKATLGEDMQTWSWGRLHHLTFAHLLGRVKPLDLVFNRGPYPVSGDGTTINSTFSRLDDDGRGVVGPPFRFIVDLADIDHSLGMLAPGQSGQPGSPHYDDQVQAWFNGEYHPMLFIRSEVEQRAEHRLTLVTSASPTMEGQRKLS